jgi:hypothetical protein
MKEEVTERLGQKEVHEQYKVCQILQKHKIKNGLMDGKENFIQSWAEEPEDISLLMGG